MFRYFPYRPVVAHVHVSPANHSTDFSIIIITWGWHNNPLSGRSVEWTLIAPPTKQIWKILMQIGTVISSTLNRYLHECSGGGAFTAGLYRSACRRTIVVGPICILYVDTVWSRYCCRIRHIQWMEFTKPQTLLRCLWTILERPAKMCNDKVCVTPNVYSMVSAK
jgi:hypothetical protein